MSELISFDHARKSLQVCASVDEAKDILDQAEAMRVYAHQVENNEMEIWLSEIKLRARRRIGEISKGLEKIKPGGAGGGSDVSTAGHIAKKDVLSDAGISHAVAVRCEKIASIPQDEFEDALQKARDNDKPVTYADVEKKGFKGKSKKDQVKNESNTDLSEIDFTVTADQTVIQCQALVTDPPYGILDEEWDDIHLESFTREWLSRWNECGADLFISAWSSRHLFDGRQWFDDELTNYDFQQLLIWHYANNKKPSSKLFFKHTYEPIYVYRRKDSKREIGVGGGDWGKGLVSFDCLVAATPQSNFNDANMKQHPAQKSLDVMRWLVNAVSSPGDLIVDPFCGSGTTGIAAKQLHRNFHGIEINDEYAQLAVRRIATYGDDSE